VVRADAADFSIPAATSSAFAADERMVWPMGFLPRRGFGHDGVTAFTDAANRPPA
jgi:hypothetical protein